MKRLFCTVITSYDNTLESPMIIHSMNEYMDHAEQAAIEYFTGEDFGFDSEMIADNFDLFTFEVTDILGQD